MRKQMYSLIIAVLIFGMLAGCAPRSEQQVSGDGGGINFEAPELELEPIETFDVSNIGGGGIDFEAPELELEPIETLDLSNVGATIEFNIPDVFFELDLEEINLDNIVNDIATNVAEEDLPQFQELEETEIVEIVTIQLNLLADLQAAFEQAGLSVQIDETTGEIALDATVLFDVDQSEVSPEGKELLQKFMQVYSYVVFHEKYEGFVSKIMIEGHTDSNGAYDYNLRLSQDRADHVLAYVLSDECGIEKEYRMMLEASTETVGYSYDKPVLDEQGQEDAAASRRVCFRFLISLS